jgi:hypothetical protein
MCFVSGRYQPANNHIMESIAHANSRGVSCGYSHLCDQQATVLFQQLTSHGPGVWLPRHPRRGIVSFDSSKTQHGGHPLGRRKPGTKNCRGNRVTCQAGAENGDPGKELKPGRKSGVLAKVSSLQFVHDDSWKGAQSDFHESLQRPITRVRISGTSLQLCFSKKLPGFNVASLVVKLNALFPSVHVAAVSSAELEPFQLHFH